MFIGNGSRCGQGCRNHGLLVPWPRAYGYLDLRALNRSRWGQCTVNEVLLCCSEIELVNQEEFVSVALLELADQKRVYAVKFCGDDQFLPRANPVEQHLAYKLAKKYTKDPASHQDEQY